MATPLVDYATTDDGVTIAYSTVGDGPVTIVLVSPMVSQVEVTWEEPALASFVRRLASFARVVLFDRRGVGLSDRSTASGERLGLSQLATDTRAVVDAVGADQVVLLGVTFGCLIAVQFAVDYPLRTAGLVLAGGFPKLTRLGEHDFLAHPDSVDVWADQTARVWGTGATLAARAPAMADSQSYRDWAARMERHTCSPGMIAAICRSAASFDVRGILCDVQAPTLVVHRGGDTWVPVQGSRYLAENIACAEYVELPGEDHTIFVGDQRATVEAITGFLDRRVTSGALKAFQRAERKDTVAFGWDSLTPSEREIARLVAGGLTNAEVAARLAMSPYTVDGRLRRIFAKLGVNNRVDLTAQIAVARR